MKIYTIGFTEKKAERFFSLIKLSGTKRIVDVRLNNISQLSGFAKRDDLKYFLKELCDVDYVHVPELAPTKKFCRRTRKRKFLGSSMRINSSILWRSETLKST